MTYGIWKYVIDENWYDNISTKHFIKRLLYKIFIYVLMWHLLFINIYYWHKYSTIKYVNQNKKPIFNTDINLIWDMHCTWKGHHARAHFLKQCQIQLYESDLHPITLISSDLWNSRNSSFITPMADRYHINYISHVYLFQPVIF